MASGTNNIRWFDTISAMRAFNIGNAQNYTAIVHGYASPGDDGGGVFHWSTDPKLDDGGTIVNPLVGGAANPSAAPGWRRIYDGPVNVKWFGAKGNGKGDDARAIQRAIDAVAAKGGIVFFPAGTYCVRSQLTLTQTKARPYNGVTLLGAGHGAQIKAAEPIAGGMIVFKGAREYGLEKSGVRNLRISGCDETTQETKDGSVGALVSFGGTDGAFVIDCHLDTNWNAGVSSSSPNLDRNFVVKGNYATRIGKWDVVPAKEKEQVSAAYDISAIDATVVGNRSFETGFAVLQEGAGAVIANNIFESVRETAISLAHTGANPYTTQRILVQGNTIRAAGNGIGVSAGEPNVAQEILIADNVIEMCRNGVAIANKGVEVVVRGNYFYGAPQPTNQAIGIGYSRENEVDIPSAVVIEDNTFVAHLGCQWGYIVLVRHPEARVLIRHNTVIGDAVTTAVFEQHAKVVNRDVEYIGNIIRRGGPPGKEPTELHPARVRYRWAGEDPAALYGFVKKLGAGQAAGPNFELLGIDDGVIFLSQRSSVDPDDGSPVVNRRPSVVHHDAVPAGGQWFVGDRCINVFPREITPQDGGATYVVERWVCVEAGSPGKWLRSLLV